MDGRDLFRKAMLEDHNIKVVFRHKTDSGERGKGRRHKRHRRRRHRSQRKRHHNKREPRKMVEKSPPPPRDFAAVVNETLSEHRLRASFPPRVEREVDVVVRRGGGIANSSLRDMTMFPFVTIDNDNSMDLDQAMYIRRSTLGGYDVLYALADGAYYVGPHSAIYEEALRRGGSSFYLPTLCIPMLPRRLSEDLMSLNENVPRRSLVFTIALDRKGHVRKTTYCWARIRSRWKGTYREAQLYYDDKLPWLRKKPFQETLDLLKEVGNLRRAIARDRQVVEFNRERGSLRVVRDPKTGRNTVVSSFKRRLKSELYNEQISLLCNMEGAKILMSAAKENPLLIHPIFRTQREPSNDQIRTLEKVIAALVKKHRLDRSTWQWHRDKGEALGAYLRRLHRHCGGKNAKFSESRVPEWQWSVLRSIDRQAMMTNVAATFSGRARGHYALRAPAYARFSSPMREIVGCFVHKELHEWATKTSSDSDAKETDAMRRKIINVALSAKRTQKKVSGACFKFVLDNLYGPDLKKKGDARPRYHGTILGMDFSKRRSTVYVQCFHPWVEIKLRVEDLNESYGVTYESSESFSHWGTTIEAVPKNPDGTVSNTAPTLVVGSFIAVSVAGYVGYRTSTRSDRWKFKVHRVTPSLPTTKSWKSTMETYASRRGT